MHRNVSFLLKSIAELPVISAVKRGDPWKLLRYTEQCVTADFSLPELYSSRRRKGMKTGIRGRSEHGEDVRSPLVWLVVVPAEAAHPHAAARDPLPRWQRRSKAGWALGASPGPQ